MTGSLCFAAMLSYTLDCDILIKSKEYRVEVVVPAEQPKCKDLNVK